VLLLDTNVCIQIWQRGNDKARRTFLAHRPSEICLCSVVKAELYYGARRSQRVESNLRLLEAFMAPIKSLPFDDRCAEEYGAIRAQLSSLGTPIGPNDLMIAATARVHDATLVTHNSREFSRITGLRMVDWETG
jgi:tRNA(fMet)-specific endonuclease VapC